MGPKPPKYDMRTCTIKDVAPLFCKYHPYAGVGRVAVYCFAVYEKGAPVAAYVWQPPPPGAAKSVCPAAPGAVLALSRMVAVPHALRALNHVSKPLRRQMKTEIDRARWPILVTYSDEGCGHTGHVYRCSGWHRTSKARRNYYVDPAGARVSCYSNGKSKSLTRAGVTTLQRWEHHACDPRFADLHMALHGWRREPVPGKVWRSGKPAFRWTCTLATERGAQMSLF